MFRISKISHLILTIPRKAALIQKSTENSNRSRKNSKRKTREKKHTKGSEEV